MLEEHEGKEGSYLSARDMHLWAQQQIKDATKALELRLREATALAAAYSSGEIMAEKADELQSRYYHRWGEALPGVSVTDAMTDEQILAGVDKAAVFSNGPFAAPGETHAQRARRSKTRSAGRDPS